MIIHALQTGTPFVYEIFRIGYCIRGNCTSDPLKLGLINNEVTGGSNVFKNSLFLLVISWQKNGF